MLRPVIYEEKTKSQILYRKPLDTASVEETVKEILKNVKENGDNALKEYTLKLDGAMLDSFAVTKEETDEAFNRVSPDFIMVIERSLENIKQFHKMQLRAGFEYEENGVLLGQKVIPVSTAGIYVPGGTAAYPSTVLMNAVPAKTAGVVNLVMVTPPQKDGKIKPEVLVAAELAGVDKIFKIGGAQAIAALAYGTETVPKADVITGPGNIYVATAKKLVYGVCGIDMIAGPSEILIIADKSANPVYIAADMLSQAEHDKLATAALITDSEEVAEKTAAEIERQIEFLPRKDIARASIEHNGRIILTKDIITAVNIANELAPEHLELCVENPTEMLDVIKNAGSVFLGSATPEAVGDYYAGTNHTLPTGGTARFSSPLGVDCFLKTTQYVYCTDAAVKAAAADITAFAEAEGLCAHAESVIKRLNDE